MHIAQINYVYDARLRDADALLERYATLKGWSDALLSAGASRVTVVQRFHGDADVIRNGVRYILVKDGSTERPRAWRALSRFHRAVALVDPDLVHVNGLGFPVETLRLRRMLASRIAIVVQDHASGDPGPGLMRGPSLRRLVWRRGLRAADAFLFSADEQAIGWRAAGLISPAQRVYPVMESSTTLRAMPRAAARQESGVDGDPAILWVGRLNANKDPLTVLDGLEQCAGALPAARLTMVYAEDDDLTAVQARLMRSATLRSRVRLAGRVPHAQMPAFYGAADLFVLGSHHEGSGYAALEACASGVVPVVTDIPAFRVITANGSLGGLWQPGDASDCARAIVDIAQRDLVAMGARVAEHFGRALSWTAVGRHAMAAYQEVVSDRQRRTC